MTRLPIIGYNIALFDIISGAKGFFLHNCVSDFQNLLSELVHSKYLYLTNSGISAFYSVLQAVKKRSQKKEVVLPAYTASTLVAATEKAGLKPVLCDISLEDFNMDTESLRGIITSETLCVVCVHMFGMPVKNVEKLRNILPDEIILIEDCAQAMGSKIGNTSVGNFGDAGIFSFNRGKNLPTYGGGCVFTNSDELSAEVEHIISGLTAPGFMDQISLYVKFLSLAIAFNPSCYALLYPFISQRKDNKNEDDFTVCHYTNVQAKLGTALFKRFDESCTKRYENAMAVISGLKNTEGILLPRMSDDLLPVFNRLPIVFRDLKRRAIAEMNLQNAGIETSRMYNKPLHHLFDLGYRKDDFPNAVYFAEHLLTVPVHPVLSGHDLERMIDTISEPG